MHRATSLWKVRQGYTFFQSICNSGTQCFARARLGWREMFINFRPLNFSNHNLAKQAAIVITSYWASPFKREIEEENSIREIDGNDGDGMFIFHADVYSTGPCDRRNAKIVLMYSVVGRVDDTLGDDLIKCGGIFSKLHYDDRSVNIFGRPRWHSRGSLQSFVSLSHTYLTADANDYFMRLKSRSFH